MADASRKISIATIDYDRTWPIRHKEMWPSKSLSYVKLPKDPEGLHYGLFLGAKLIGVVSLFITQEQAQFRKLAVLREYQGKGYGGKLVQHILKVCALKKIEKVWCNARKDKLDFYTKYGFANTKEEFVKGGISYCIITQE